MKEIHNDYRKDDLLIIDIPDIYKTETARKTCEYRQITEGF